VPDLQLHGAMQLTLLDHSFGNPDAFRVSDSDDSGFHYRSLMRV
jgi:hypothetical protein